MSWSISIAGKPAAVASKAKEELARIRCVEPEQSIKTDIGGIIEKALGVFPENAAVRVDASGSQWSPEEGKFANSVKLSIEPIYGFVE